MKFSKLEKSFPDIKKVPSQACIHIKLEDEDAYLPINNLTPREKILCSVLLNKELSHSRLSEWQLYLNGQGRQPKIKERIRFLHFKVRNLRNENKTQWKEEIISFFAKPVSSFWQNSENFIIVDTSCDLLQKDFDAILTTMDSDFLTRTSLLMGLVWPGNVDLISIFMEEEKINESIVWRKSIMTIPESALAFYTQYNKKDSVIIKSYKNYFKEKNDFVELVINLYQVGGNLTKAAKNMFIHRNTLEYRINKIMKKYYLNLHKMDDLVFCYLIFV